MNVIEQNVFAVCKCIYCGEAASKLTDEHAVPYGLGGDAIVLKTGLLRKMLRHHLTSDT